MMKRGLAVLGLGLALSGCALWSSDKGPQPSPLPVFQPSAEVKLDWRARVSAAADAVLRPAVVGDSVFAAGADGAISRFNKGQEVWRAKEAKGITSGVVSDGQIVVVGATSGELVAYDANTGAQRWRYAAGGDVMGAPFITDDLVIARIGDNQIVAVGRSDGKRRWVYQRVQAVLSLRTYSGFARAGDLLIAGFPGGKLMALTLAGGFPRWEATVAVPRGSNELERMADVVGDPVVQGDVVCVAAFQGRVACVDAASGVVRWTRDFSSAVGVDVDAKNVYVTDELGDVLALELGSGATVWKQDKLIRRGVGRPLVVGTRIAVADSFGWVHLLSPLNGGFLANYQLDDSGAAAPMSRFGGDGRSWIAQTRNGSVYALSLAK